MNMVMPERATVWIAWLASSRRRSPRAAPLDFDACDDEGRPFGLESFHTL
jgi:hypothetical protein